MKVDEIKLSESWKTANQRSLHAAVHLVDSIENYSIVDEVSADTCVLLQTDQQSSECPVLSLTITPPVQHVILGLSLLSEARHLEIHNHKNEYITTVRSVLIDNVDEDFIVYRSDVKFTEPLTDCKIKFLSLRSPNEMWFYGGAIQVAKQLPTIKPNTDQSLNLGHLLTQLEGDGRHLSDNAKSFANLLQTFSNANMPSNLPLFMSLFSRKDSHKQLYKSESGMQAPTNGTVTQQECQTCARQCKVSTINPDDKQSNSLNVTTAVENSTWAKDNSLLEATLQPLFSELEEKLWIKLKTELEEQEKRQMEKLNQIVKLLEELKLT